MAVLLHYYGTELTSAGHYFFILERDGMYRHARGLMDHSKCPFNPEALPYRLYRDGDCAFYQFAGMSIWAIIGSCKDKRPGSRTVFFVEELVLADELKRRVLATAIGKQIVANLPVQPNW